MSHVTYVAGEIVCHVVFKQKGLLPRPSVATALGQRRGLSGGHRGCREPDARGHWGTKRYREPTYAGEGHAAGDQVGVWHLLPGDEGPRTRAQSCPLPSDAPLSACLGLCSRALARDTARCAATPACPSATLVLRACRWGARPATQPLPSRAGPTPWALLSFPSPERSVTGTVMSPAQLAGPWC